MLTKDDSWLALCCKQKRLCKFKKILNSSGQIMPNIIRMLNYSSLFSCPYDNHFKEEEILPYMHYYFVLYIVCCITRNQKLREGDVTHFNHFSTLWVSVTMSVSSNFIKSCNTEVPLYTHNLWPIHLSSFSVFRCCIYRNRRWADSDGFWRWCITLRINTLLDFVHRTVF
jgi:hypothetical protein